MTATIERLWSIEDVCAYLGVPVEILYRWGTGWKTTGDALLANSAALVREPTLGRPRRTRFRIGQAISRRRRAGRTDSTEGGQRRCLPHHP